MNIYTIFNHDTHETREAVAMHIDDLFMHNNESAQFVAKAEKAMIGLPVYVMGQDDPLSVRYITENGEAYDYDGHKLTIDAIRTNKMFELVGEDNLSPDDCDMWLGSFIDRTGHWHFVSVWE